MKGAVLSISPGATLVDISHAVPPQDVLHGAYVLSSCWEAFPPGTVHVAVVDPGVGTGRKAVAVAHRGHVFVGPDNGLLSLALGMADQAEPSPGGGLVPRPEPLPFNTRAYETTNRRYFRERVSSTFHGRDVFAPVAARLALGLSVAVLGLRLDSLLTIPIGRPRRSPDGVVGVVLHMDAYGNGVTNIREADVNLSTDSVAAGGRRLPLLATYGEAAPGQALALWGSSGTLEIAVRDGSAAKDLGLRRGDRVLVESSPRCPA